MEPRGTKKVEGIDIVRGVEFNVLGESVIGDSGSMARSTWLKEWR